MAPSSGNWSRRPMPTTFTGEHVRFGNLRDWRTRRALNPEVALPRLRAMDRTPGSLTAAGGLETNNRAVNPRTARTYETPSQNLTFSGVSRLPRPTRITWGRGNSTPGPIARATSLNRYGSGTGTSRQNAREVDYLQPQLLNEHVGGVRSGISLSDSVERRCSLPPALSFQILPCRAYTS